MSNSTTKAMTGNERLHALVSSPSYQVGSYFGDLAKHCAAMHLHMLPSGGDSGVHAIYGLPRSLQMEDVVCVYIIEQQAERFESHTEKMREIIAAVEADGMKLLNVGTHSIFRAIDDEVSRAHAALFDAREADVPRISAVVASHLFSGVDSDDMPFDLPDMATSALGIAGAAARMELMSHFGIEDSCSGQTGQLGKVVEFVREQWANSGPVETTEVASALGITEDQADELLRRAVDLNEIEPLTDYTQWVPPGESESHC